MQNRNLIEKDLNKKAIPRYSDKYKDVLLRIAQDELKKNVYQQYIPFFYRVKSIGVGAHSIVYLAQEEQTKAIYAQKCITIQHSKKIKEDLIGEIKIHFRLDHKNIIKLYHFYADELSFNLIMEVGFQSLFSVFNQKIKNNELLKQQEIVWIISQILCGIQYLHSVKIIHADLKLENIIVKNGEIKICDFGYAHKVGSESKKQVVGTLEYLSPELIEKNISTEKRDIWAIGIMCFEMLSGKNPLKHLSENQKWLKLLKFDGFQIDFEVSTEIRQFLDATLCQFHLRKTAQELLTLPLFAKYPKEIIRFQ